jgi:tetratricopeptide (TPR) repeat protein
LVAATLVSVAFIANGGLQLGSSTLVEVAVLSIGAVLVAAAIVAIGLEAQLHGAAALGGLVALAALTALSIGWSLHPSDSWVETNRTLAYLAAFGGGVAAVRLARGRWAAVAAGVLLALAAIAGWGLATKVAPGWLAPDEIYGRLREPYDYWNAVGVTAAMGMPLCLWLGTRPQGRQLVNALAWPLLGLFIVTLLLSFSRGSIVAAAFGIAIWLALVPLRLRSLALLLPAAVAATGVAAWAFGESGITDDRIALSVREDSGVVFGLLLAAMVVLLFAAGVAIQRRAERRPLTERARRRLGAGAIGAVLLAPVIALAALAFTERGIGGTISDRWHDLTTAEATPQNQPGRLTETSSVRSIYWQRAVDVWQDHEVAGAGAGAFEQAQLRYREEQARGKHAHGYVLQTLADLGLIGLAVSLVALGAWLLAARNTLGLRRGRWTARDWSPERTGLAALAVVAIVFGVHSALDWTWFVPAVTMTALFCAGWVAGRGPLEAGARSSPYPPLQAVNASLPRRPLLYRRLVPALGIVAMAVVAALAVAQPWRAEQKGEEALRLASERDLSEARGAALRAKDLNPLSVEPYFELAAVEDAAGRGEQALTALQQAVRVEPASPEAWRRLGEHYVIYSQPESALPVLRASLYLDPLSNEGRAAYVAALRAQQPQRRERRTARR